MREYWTFEKIVKEFDTEEIDGTELLSYDWSGYTKEQWVEFRSNLLGIGGSGIGTIMGHNLYKDPLTYFYEIIGLIQGKFTDTTYTFWGTMFEDSILKAWQYWGGTPKSMYENMKTDNKVSRAYDPYKTFINPEYPYLFANLDGIITKHRQYGNQKGILEIKNLSAQYADRFKMKAPVKYFLQVHHYMMVMGLEYGELAIRNSRGEFRVFPIKRNDSIREKILRTSTRFMEAVKLALDTLPSVDTEEEALDICIEIENMYSDVLTVGSSPEMRKHMSKRHSIRKSLVQIEPEPELEELAVKYMAIKQQIKNYEDQYHQLGNQIRRSMTQRKANKVEGDGWYISFNKRLMVNVSEKKINDEINRQTNSHP